MRHVSWRLITGKLQHMCLWGAEEEHTVVDFAAGYYAIFDIDADLILPGVIPVTHVRTETATARRKYGHPRTV